MPVKTSQYRGLPQVDGILKKLFKNEMAPQAQKQNTFNVELVEDEYWLFIPGKPASARARKRQAKARLTRYKRLLKSTASMIFNHPIKGDVQMTIYHFHKGTVIDMDNMEKPILDGLTGTSYHDDIQVTKKNTERFNLTVSNTIRDVTTTFIPRALADGKECVVIGIKSIN